MTVFCLFDYCLTRLNTQPNFAIHTFRGSIGEARPRAADILRNGRLAGLVDPIAV